MMKKRREQKRPVRSQTEYDPTTSTEEEEDDEEERKSQPHLVNRVFFTPEEFIFLDRGNTPVKSTDHSVDPVKLEQWILAHPKSFQPAARLFANTIRYVSTEQWEEEFFAGIDYFVETTEEEVETFAIWLPENVYQENASCKSNWRQHIY